MSTKALFIIFFIISLFGCIYCPHWIKHARNRKDKSYGIFTFVTSILLTIGAIIFLALNYDMM